MVIATWVLSTARDALRAASPPSAVTNPRAAKASPAPPLVVVPLPTRCEFALLYGVRQKSNPDRRSKTMTLEVSSYHVQAFGGRLSRVLASSSPSIALSAARLTRVAFPLLLPSTDRPARKRMLAS